VGRKIVDISFSASPLVINFVFDFQETNIEQLNSRRQEILENCELEQIKLPIAHDPDSMDIDSAQPIIAFDYSQLRLSHQQV
jgi:structural maintenance of chromosome 1